MSLPEYHRLPASLHALHERLGSIQLPKNATERDDTHSRLLVAKGIHHQAGPVSCHRRMRSCLTGRDSSSKLLFLTTDQHGQSNDRGNGSEDSSNESKDEHSEPKFPAPLLTGEASRDSERVSACS